MGEVVYLDVCCFKRPFDDASVERIRREAEAVAAILDAASAGSVDLVRSPAHDFENESNPREDRRLATRLWLDAAVRRLVASPSIDNRAGELVALGFRPLDALHVAFAERAEARWFVTTDDRPVSRAAKHRDALRVAVITPDRIPRPLDGDAR